MIKIPFIYQLHENFSGRFTMSILNDGMILCKKLGHNSPNKLILGKNEVEEMERWVWGGMKLGTTVFTEGLIFGMELEKSDKQSELVFVYE